MQGRLVDAPDNEHLDWFPTQNWQEEFKLAKEIGLGSIELVFDRGRTSLNPLLARSGRAMLRKEFSETGLLPYSCCLNFIIDNSIKNEDVFELCVESLKFLNELDIKMAVLPLFGESDLETYDTLKELIKLTAIAKDYDIKILIESNQNASWIMKFLDDISLQSVGVVYDIGNASLCGHSVENELLLLQERVAHVHIKDKIQSGLNVPLGSGIVNFAKVFEALSEIKYQGRFTLETCKGENALISAAENLAFVKMYMTRFGLESNYEI